MLISGYHWGPDGVIDGPGWHELLRRGYVIEFFPFQMIGSSRLYMHWDYIFEACEFDSGWKDGLGDAQNDVCI